MVVSGGEEASLPVVGCGGVRLDQRASHAAHKKLGTALNLVATYGKESGGNWPALRLRTVLLGRRRATPPQLLAAHSPTTPDEATREETPAAEASAYADGVVPVGAEEAEAAEALAEAEAATLPFVFNPRLDAFQRAAVAFSLASEDVSLIHGPPGTGKTTTLVELLLQVGCRNRASPLNRPARHREQVLCAK